MLTGDIFAAALNEDEVWVSARDKGIWMKQHKAEDKAKEWTAINIPLQKELVKWS